MRTLSQTDAPRQGIRFITLYPYKRSQPTRPASLPPRSAYRREAGRVEDLGFLRLKHRHDLR